MTTEDAPTILGLRAWAQAGKDTLALAYIDEDQFERLAFADFMREALYALNPLVVYRKRWRRRFARLAELVDDRGWDAAKQIPEVRQLMQRFGTEAGRNVLGQDVWVNALFNRVLPGHRYVITDVRFPNEAQRIKDHGGEVWRVTRPGVGPANDHISEHALDDWPFDAEIANDSTVESFHERGLRLLRERMPLLGH